MCKGCIANDRWLVETPAGAISSGRCLHRPLPQNEATIWNAPCVK